MKRGFFFAFTGIFFRVMECISPFGVIGRKWHNRERGTERIPKGLAGTCQKGIIWYLNGERIEDKLHSFLCLIGFVTSGL